MQQLSKYGVHIGAGEGVGAFFDRIGQLYQKEGKNRLLLLPRASVVNRITFCG